MRTMNASPPGTDLRGPPEPYTFDAFVQNMNRIVVHFRRKRLRSFNAEIQRDLDYGRD